MGRKVKYDFTDKQLLIKIEGFARDGWDNKQIADYYGYNETYFSELQTKYPELADAIKAGHKPLEIIVENSLFKRATGMKVKTTTRRWLVKDGVQTDVEIIQETETEVPPDTGAAAFWLKQKKPDVWNKQPDKVDLTSGGKKIPPARVLTKNEIKGLLKELETEY